MKTILNMCLKLVKPLRICSFFFRKASERCLLWSTQQGLLNRHFAPQLQGDLPEVIGDRASSGFLLIVEEGLWTVSSVIHSTGIIKLTLCPSNAGGFTRSHWGQSLFRVAPPLLRKASEWCLLWSAAQGLLDWHFAPNCRGWPLNCVFCDPLHRDC